MREKATLEYGDGEECQLYVRVPLNVEFDRAVLAILEEIPGFNLHMDEIDNEVYHDVRRYLADVADLVEGHLEGCRRIAQNYYCPVHKQYIRDMPHYDTEHDTVMTILDHYKDYKWFRREGRHVPPYTR